VTQPPHHRRTHGGTGAGVLALVKPLPPRAVAGWPGFTRAKRPRLRSPRADRWASIQDQGKTETFLLPISMKLPTEAAVLLRQFAERAVSFDYFISDECAGERDPNDYRKLRDNAEAGVLLVSRRPLIRSTRFAIRTSEKHAAASGSV
jgi:hypothetical protein